MCGEAARCAQPMVLSLRARLGGLRGLRMALDEQAQLVDAGVLLVHLQQRQASCELRGGSLGIAGEAFEHRVVGLDRFSVIELAVGDFAEVELRRAGQVVHRVVVQHVLKFAGGHIVVGGVVVAEAGLKVSLSGGAVLAGGAP